MQVLVTGGAGFIGSAVCRLLIAETDWSVVNVDKLTYAGTRTSVADIENSSRYSFIQADISDASAIGSIFGTHDFEAVIHLAAETHVDRSITDANPFINTNIVGAFQLLQAALHHWERLPGSRRDSFRLLNVSTDEVFGSLGTEGRFDESTSYDPRSPYAASKAAADHLVSAWNTTYGLPTLLTNCSNNFGPYQFPEKLIPLTILKCLAGQAIPVYGDGLQVRDWLYVEDHARAIRLVLETAQPGSSYVIGAESERTNLHIVQTICDLVAARRPGQGSRHLITRVPDRPGHDRRYAINPAKLRRDLNWRPRRSFEDELARTVDWYLDRRDWWEPLVKRYDGSRLGLQT